MQTQRDFIVVGVRSNGETLFLCNDATQGRRFVPYAQSRAERFDNRLIAEGHAIALRSEFKGLKIWVEPTVDDLNEWPVNR
jgi:hypothetical protein